jgi:O-antigen/teichoic acid export membrane protein
MRLPGAWRAEPLWRGSTFLILNSVIATGLGFLAWMVTARLWTAAEVGIAAAAVSAASLAASVAMLGVPGTVMRFLPTSDNPARLLGTALAVTLSASVLLGVVVGVWQSGDVAHGWAWLSFLMLLMLVVGLSVKAVLEALLIARRSSDTVLLATGGGNAVKIAATVLFGVLGTGPLGIVAANLATAVTSLGVLRHRAWPLLDRASLRSFSWRVVNEFRGFSLTFYASGVVSAIPVLVLPLIVKDRLGAQAAGYWYVASLMAVALYQLPSAVGATLLVESSHRRTEMGRLVLRASLGLAALMVPLVVLAWVLAPWVLRLFGPDYATQSLASFRILAVSALPLSASYLLGNVLAVRRRVGPLLALRAVNASVVVVLAVLSTTLDQVAWSWFFAEAVSVILIAIAIPLFQERAAVPGEPEPDLTAAQWSQLE